MSSFWQNLSAADWATMAVALVGAGIGSAAVQAGLTCLGERKERRARATYMAARLITVLEGFAADCEAHAARARYAQQRVGQAALEWNAALPTFPQLPGDPDGWCALDRDVIVGILDMPNRMKTSAAEIAVVAEFDEGKVGDEIILQAAERGLDAINWANTLRGRHRLRKHDPIQDVEGALRAEVQEIQNRRAEEKTRQQA